MLDLETLDTSPTAVIVSIGAVKFNKDGSIGKSFYDVIDRSEQVAKGRTINPQTLDWWFKQSEEARSVFKITPCTSVKLSLEAFSIYASETGEQVNMWGNGADFDCVLLGSLYETFGLKKPWSYSNNRCFRTLKNICIAKDSHAMPQREGTHHNALDDAVYQAKCAIAYLNGKLK